MVRPLLLSLCVLSLSLHAVCVLPDFMLLHFSQYTSVYLQYLCDRYSYQWVVLILSFFCLLFFLEIPSLIPFSAFPPPGRLTHPPHSHPGSLVRH